MKKTWKKATSLVLMGCMLASSIPVSAAETATGPADTTDTSNLPEIPPGLQPGEEPPGGFGGGPGAVPSEGTDDAATPAEGTGDASQTPAEGTGDAAQTPSGGTDIGGGDATGGMPGMGDMNGMPGMSESDMAMMGSGAPEQATIYIKDNAEQLNETNEYQSGVYSESIKTLDGVVTISNLALTSGVYTENGIVIDGADSDVRLDNLKLNWTVGDTVTDENAVGGIGVAVQDGTLRISNSKITVDGDGGRSGRYAVAAYGTATMVVNNTTIEQTGRNEKTAVIPEAPSNEALLISGNARANFSIGNTETYYFNSSCIAEGWAALSTDSAQGDGLDLYAYNTTAIAQNGGYGIYADTDCRDRLYGCTLKSAEVGAIISNNGSITLADGTAANDVVLENGEKLMSYNEGDRSQTDGTLLQGGRNAVMMHAPDMMGQGKASSNTADFSATNSTLSTTKDLVSTKDYSDYGTAVGEYVDFISGADILVKSTSANINLDNVTMESYSNTLVETVINADSMGNFLAEGDGNEVNPVTVNMSNMTATGDILHYDYQRRMSVNLSNTTLNGAIVSGTIDTWKGIWSKYQTGEVNWLPNDTYATTYGAALTLSGNSVWNVTGESTLSSLTVEAGSTINGTVTVDGKEVTPEAGKTYTGSIVVTKKAEAATTVAKVKGVKASSAKSGKLTVKYTKLANAAGYQIQYSTDKKFKSSVKTASVKKSVTSKTLKVKAGKKYYVRVRAYAKASDGSKVYGAYSKTANIKVKK